MRLRSTILPVAGVVALMAVYDLGRQGAGPVETLVSMAERVTSGALYAVGFWGASVVLKKWLSHPERMVAQPAMPTPPPPLPVPNFITAPWSCGPGQYRVRGVDRDTNFETTEVIFADSPSSAQLKVELKGVHVAAVERAY